MSKHADVQTRVSASLELDSARRQPEFSENAHLPPPEGTRRDFLRIMGASVALAGTQGCTQPEEKIVPYVRQPENVVPGKPRYYATAMAHDGSAIGLLVESHMGRPTKIEGNPLHPAVPEVMRAANERPAANFDDQRIRFAASDAFAQAAVLALYDPDRSQVVLRDGQISTWASFVTDLKTRIDARHSENGRGLRILSEAVISPTLVEQRRKLLGEFPEAAWHNWEPIHRDNEVLGTRMAYGEDLSPIYDLSLADVILSLDADFLADGPWRLQNAHEFAGRRRVNDFNNAASMNRLYMLDSSITLTGAAADHRLPAAPADILRFAVSVAAEFGLDVETPAGTNSQVPSRWLEAVVDDLRQAQADGRASLIVAGRWQPPAVHAIAAWLNAELGNVGKSIKYVPLVDAESSTQGESLSRLIADMRQGNVELLLILGGNPALTCPEPVQFAPLVQNVPTTIHLSQYVNETSKSCTWHIPQAHFLEEWSDVRSIDGTVSIVQPLIAPLYGGKSTHEVVEAVLGNPQAKSHDVVREFWFDQFSADAEENWQVALHDGLFAGIRFDALEPRIKDGLAAEVGASANGYFQQFDGDKLPIVVLRPDPSVWDGRFVNNGWLQELPRPFTKLTWDNAILLSPKVAEDYDVQTGDIMRLSSSDIQVSLPVFVVPGHPDATATVHVGYGQSAVGRVGSNVGSNAYPLRRAADTWFAANIELSKTASRHSMATTQHHHGMEGRHHLITGTLQEFAEHPADPHFMHHVHAPQEEETFYPQRDYNGYKWGMAVDLTACTGCNGCVIACQAENNIPVAGKDQVAMGREMHWLRIDHYYDDDVRSFHQPVMCQHCELAPCEVVCPVVATTHSDEGLNEMTYNRCVGTRYCANNCPYKVRRFNYFNYGAMFGGEPVLELLANPDVSIRERGVMEKCTFCVQRINSARIEAEKQNRTIRDGEILTACQAACPSEAIVFGDLNDETSRVAALLEHPANYSLLADLNTRPRTTYLAAIRNPHPLLRDHGHDEPTN